VNDVSRMAMLGAGHGGNDGYYILKLTTIHAIADSQTEVLNAYFPVNNFGTYTDLDPSLEWLWIMDAYMSASAGGVNLTRATVIVNAGTGGGPVTLLGAFEPAGSGAGVNEAARLIYFSDEPTADGFIIPHAGILTRPEVLTFAQGVISLFTTSSGAGTYNLSVLVWRGPKGSTPPGIF